jgi:general secretion pathway protein A
VVAASSRRPAAGCRSHVTYKSSRNTTNYTDDDGGVYFAAANRNEGAAMYLSHWGLADSPFSKERHAREFFRAPPQDEALARLNYLVDQRRRLGLLCGPTGVGKTLLLDVFAQQLRREDRQVAFTSLVDRSARELLWEIADQLGATPGRDEDVPLLWRRVADRVAQNRWQKLDTVLLVDDADAARPDILATFARLVEVDPSPDARWTIILATSEDGSRRLGERLLDRVALRVDLTKWLPEDTIEYVRQTLAAAGGDASIFEDNALRSLHETADGMPRRINRLVDLALVAGAGQQLAQLDAQTIESVAELAVV